MRLIHNGLCERPIVRKVFDKRTVIYDTDRRCSGKSRRVAREVSVRPVCLQGRVLHRGRCRSAGRAGRGGEARRSAPRDMGRPQPRSAGRHRPSGGGIYRL